MIYFIIFSHWVADFIAQSDWMAKNKSKSWVALSTHILAYTATLLAIISVANPSIHAWKYALVNGAAHFVVDAITSRITAKLYAKADIHNFFVVIGLDQAIHMATLIATMPLLYYSYSYS